MPDRLHRLVGKEVVVTTGDISYRGILKEVTDEMVFLQGLTGWRQIPIDRVVDISAAEPGKNKPGRR